VRLLDCEFSYVLLIFVPISVKQKPVETDSRNSIVLKPLNSACQPRNVTIASNRKRYSNNELVLRLGIGLGLGLGVRFSVQVVQSLQGTPLMLCPRMTTTTIHYFEITFYCWRFSHLAPIERCLRATL